MGSRILENCTVIIACFFSVMLACPAQAVISSELEQELVRLVQIGEFDSAHILLSESPHDRADKLLLDGRISKVQGQLPEAIRQFRQALQLAPGFLIAKRELAHTLLLTQDYGAAEHHFNALLRSDRNEHMRAGYMRFLNVVRQNKPIGFSGYFSFLPSTNINRGTTNTIFDTVLGDFIIDPETRAASGVGLQIGASGYFRHVANQSSRYTLNWSVSSSRYKEDGYNSTIANLGLSYESVTRSGNFVITPYYRKTWRQDDTGNEAFGLQLALTRRISDQSQLRFSLGHELRNYSVQNYQDTSITTGSFNLGYQINPSVSLSGGFGFERNRPNAEHLQYDSYRVFANLSKSWKGGLQTSFGIETGYRNYVGDYPLTTFARDDDFYKISIGVQHTRIDINGFTPHLLCSHTINRSNVAFFDYKATECQAAISRNF